ncbi:Protein DCAR-1 [Aphelenchoides avenae]|nr:Protein DCAR-1 [Aphelenchus avenae]
MYKVRNIVGIVDYLFTIGCFLVIVFLVRKARKFASSFHQKSDKEGKKPRTIGNRFPMWKIALNVATFACFHSFYAMWNAFMLYNRDPCLFQRNYIIMQKILGVVRFGLLCRIVMDPILSFITDFQVRRSVLQLLGISKKKAREFSSSEERTTGTMVETISPSQSVRTNHKISNASSS